MKYNHVILGTFIERPNRFIAKVEIDGSVQTVHVKNTGRCKELLIKGVTVALDQSDNPARKTAYDLIAVMKEGLGWVNIDSQVPNTAVLEWIREGHSPFSDITLLKPEYTYGDSRIDVYLECGDKRKILIEVKGCTLEIDKEGYFPDAPTSRGLKHLKELQKAVKEGYECYLAFVIAMPGVTKVHGNCITHPEFAEELEKAEQNGVHILMLPCSITPDSISITY